MAAEPEAKSGKGRRMCWTAVTLRILKCLLSQVYCRPFPISKDSDIVKEENLYIPIANCLYEPVNLAAKVLELKAKYSISPGKLQHGHLILMTS